MHLDRNLTGLRWLFIALFCINSIVKIYFTSPLMSMITPLITVLTLFAAVILHGKVRYGWVNILFFFLITWLISHFFEALSIQTGFPFGHYFYDKLAGPRLFNVPLIIMPAYFGMGYLSWVLATILLNQYNRPLNGKLIFQVPLIGTFIMVMWDICMDPLASTMGSLWKWTEGGYYFGVPLQNYFGWFLVVYIILQLFACYIAQYRNENPIFNRPSFWFEAILLYAVQALTHILFAFTQTARREIFAPMALITVFTMIFVAILAAMEVANSRLQSRASS